MGHEKNGRGKTAANKNVKPQPLRGGRPVTPILIDNRCCGGGRFMGGLVDNQIVVGKDGNPLPLRYVYS